MILSSKGESAYVGGTKIFIGMDIVGTDESAYEGLKGRVIEIRTDTDKETDNEGYDIYCQFDVPVGKDTVQRLEKKFTKLCGRPMSVDDIALDSVIMAPCMIEPAVSADNLKLLAFDIICNAFALAGFDIADGGHDFLIIRHIPTGMDFEIKIEEIAG